MMLPEIWIKEYQSYGAYVIWLMTQHHESDGRIWGSIGRYEFSDEKSYRDKSAEIKKAVGDDYRLVEHFDSLVN